MLHTLVNCKMLFVGNRHANEIAALSLSLLKTLKYMREYSSKFPQVQIRLGVHSGSTVGGVVGSKLKKFCLFGDTVNVASRLEMYSDPGKIHVSSNTKALLDLTESNRYDIRLRGNLQIKVSHIINCFQLLFTLI